MTHSRRTWIHGLLAAAACLFWRRPAEAQTAGGAYCAGVVSDLNQKGLTDLIVQLVEPGGRVQSDTTKNRGEFRLPAPAKGTYIVVFREPQSKTQLHDVRQLTAGANQQLCVTIDPSRSSFQGAYAALQAVETLAAWAMGGDVNRQQLVKAIPVQDWLSTITAVARDLEKADLPARQKEFLATKSTTVQKLVASAAVAEV